VLLFVLTMHECWSILTVIVEPFDVSPAAIATVIVGVLVASGFLAWMMWRSFRSVERMERDPRYLRRWLIWLVTIYVLGAVFAVSSVITGKQPIQSLAGLPVVLLLAWLYLRSALKVNVPPK
jgi:hypothetical protein